MINTDISVLHIVPLAGRQSGGLGPVALGLGQSQRELGISAVVWSCDSLSDTEAIQSDMTIPHDMLVTYRVQGPARLAYSYHMNRAATSDPGRSFHVTHQHGIWTSCSRVVSNWRKRFDRPVVIAPHGSLEPWAMGKSRLKKMFAKAAFENENLRNASCIHALAEAEIAGIRDYGLKQPIAVIGNGLPSTWLISEGDAERFYAKHNIPSSKRTILFLSRITPKKGLPILLKAYASLLPDIASWQLVLAGPDEFGHKQELTGLITDLGLTHNVVFTGPLFGQEKRDAFSAASVFVLPSYSEGAPIAILEALGASVPVIATHASPWKQLLEHDCGWWTEASETAIRESIYDATHRPITELTEMGARGKQLVQTNYTWDATAAKTIELYRWLLGQSDKPDFVVND